MKRTLTAYLTEEDGWYVAQCLEVDVASQGESEADAMTNLGEALHLHFMPPVATELPRILPLEVELAA
jgi:predicted RNase H-like HicB family nuclease